MTFPFYYRADQLEPDDFELFVHYFSEILLSLIPYASGPVNFHACRQDAAPDRRAGSEPESQDTYIEQVKKTKQPVVDDRCATLYLPIWKGDDLLGTAVLEGVDIKLLKRFSTGWLLDRSHIISREFHLIKKLAQDPATGLLNVHHLQKELDYMLQSETPFTLTMVELCPKVADAAKALRYIVNAGYYLGSLLAHFPLHHLGCGIFAHIWHGIDDEQAQKLAKTLLDLLKREGFVQVHLGMASVGVERMAEQAVDVRTEWSVDTILNRAWQALRAASGRGPYALCPYSSIGNPDMHPLRRPSLSVMAKLRTLWQGLDSFAVAFVQQDGERPADEVFSKRALTLLEAETKGMFANGKGVYVFLDSPDREKALAWARNTREKLNRIDNRTISIGIAIFPCHGFTKADMVMNARKALLHTRFYGPDTTTVFDAVSLNVSGDIYYSEGDLKRAVREYRSGLMLDPDNTNLMNSLGEAYAQMNLHKKAVHFFRKVLRLDSGNYMALFNLGVTYLVMKDEKKATGCFEKALAIRRKGLPASGQYSADESKADYDLFFQLGRLYFEAGRYEEALGLLTDCVAISDRLDRADRANGKRVRRGGAYRYLGAAYKALGRNRDAMSVLQRAVRFNPRDSVSLSLLGELYLLEKQGDDIALSLCRQALELDDSRWEHWYRLALVRFRLNQYEEARTLLEQSLQRNRKSIPAMWLLCQAYQECGLHKDALRTAAKLLRLQPAHRDARATLAKLRKNNSRCNKSG